MRTQDQLLANPFTFARGVWDVEVGVPLRALRFVASGFRATRGPGFAYDRGGVTGIVLVAFAVTTVPQMAVFDLLFSHLPIVRIASVVLHLYAIVWMLAIAHAVQSQLHHVDATGATFCFPLLRSIRVAHDQIASVSVVGARPRKATRFGLGRAGLIVELRTAIVPNQPFFARATQRLFVGVDDPRALAARLDQFQHVRVRA